MELRDNYDAQIKIKREKEENEKKLDRQLGQQIRDKVQTIDALTTLNDHARILKRGAVALENSMSHNKAKAKVVHQREVAKQQTKSHNVMGEAITYERHLLKLDYEA